MKRIKFQFNEAIGFLEILPGFLSEGLKYAGEKGIDSVRVTAGRLMGGGPEFDVDFSAFEGCGFIRKFTLEDDFKIRSIAGIEALYSLEGLRSITLVKDIEMDLQRLKGLRELHIGKIGKLKNIGSLTQLEGLLISFCRDDDCNNLGTLSSLKSLRLCGSLTNLDGISGLRNLSSVKLSYAPKLENADSLVGLPALTDVHVEKCAKLHEFDFLSGTGVRKLFISEVDSLAFVREMKELEDLVFWNCKDGNLQPLFECERLRKVWFSKEKKHYSHSRTSVVDAVEGRWSA